MRTIWILVAAFFLTVPAYCENPLFDKLQTSVIERDEAAFLSLSLQDEASQRNLKTFIQSVFSFPYQKGVIRLAEEKPDRMILHVFLQAPEEARFESWVVHIQKDVEQQPRIRMALTINAITGLYRLKMSDRPFVVRNLKFKHVDSVLHFRRGHIFPIFAGKRKAGLLFLGEATFEFAPSDPTEQQQITLFAKEPKLVTQVTKLYIRSSPESLDEMLKSLSDQTPSQQAELYAQAQTEAKSFDRNVYSVRIPFTEELWFAQMEFAELYCEMKSSHGTLVYQHSPNEPDNVLLARKDKEQIISLYDADLENNPPETEDEFKILSYKMKMAFQPSSTHLSSVTTVRLEASKETSSIIFRLNPELRVSQIRSSQGYLIYFQERKTNNLHLVLNEAVHKGAVIDLDFFYQGRISPETRSSETMLPQVRTESDFYLPPTYLYSNQSNWYPQLASRPYSAGEASITVPEKYAAIFNGKRTSVSSERGNVTYTYQLELPAKYFTLFVGRLDSHLQQDSIVPIDVYYLSLDRRTAEEYATEADKILRFYTKYFGEYPYQNFSIVLRPVAQPGGHAPATYAIVNRVFKFFQKKFAKDPLYIPEYPNFLLAHEIAHQWWGQTVGWKTYRDQWLSEGFAQFAAWEYMRTQYGDAVWKKLADGFQEWVEEKTYAGPLILGARLGHITEDPQAFTALLYNKGAFTLNMLKNWMGEETFTRCLVEFFETYRFQRAGVQEFREIAQKHSKEDLKPFFDQWLFGWDVPEIQWSATSEDSTVRIQFQQRQAKAYQMRIPVMAKSKTGESFRFVAAIAEQRQEVSFDVPFVPASIEIDPLHETLMKTLRY